MERSELNELLGKAKIQLMDKPDSTFFTTVCFSQKFVWDEECSTAYTNGTVIGFNPDFFLSMSMDERVGVLIHEAMHVAYMHMIRGEGYDHGIFNDAADHVINLQLLSRGFKLPDFVLADRRFEGMGTEEVYQILYQERDQSPLKNRMQDLRAPEEGNAANGGNASIEKRIQDILVRAAIQSKMAGESPSSIPSDIRIFLDSILNPKLPWHQILRRYLLKYNKTNYSFIRPNRRYMPNHYLPSRRGQSLVDLAIFVDASSSVTNAQFKRFISETFAILKSVRPKKITLVQFTTHITAVDEVKSAQDLLNVKFTGRGGTYIQPVFDWANEHKPEAMLIFTDGYFRWPDKQTDVDTIWIINDNANFKAPFGQVIHYTS